MHPDPAQPLADIFRHAFHTTILPIAILATVAGILLKMFENWSVGKVRKWRQRREASKYAGLSEDEI